MKRNRYLDSLVKKAVHSSFQTGKLQVKVVNKLVLEFKKLPTRKAIYTLTGYVKGLKRELSKQTAVVESATPLSQSERSLVLKKLQPATRILNSYFILNPSLYGGFRVKIGDDVIDFSIKNRINQLKGTIANG